MTGNIGSELTLLIPKDGAKVFPRMFEELEARQAELGINSYGMSITTMEEVFLKVSGSLEPRPGYTAGRDAITSSPVIGG